MTNTDSPPDADAKFAGGPLQGEVMAVAHAVAFLTRIPLPAFPYNPELQGKSVSYFPMVGLLIGLIGAGVFELAHLIWPASIAIVLAMAATIVSTGAFHEDGLADSADGIGGGWTVDDKLRIMKDSRIGTYGGLALVLVVLLKFTALDALPDHAISSALIVAHVVGRWSTLPLLRYCSYLGDGTGNPFVGSVTDRRLLAASGGTFLITVFFVGEHTIAILLCAIVCTCFSGVFFRRKIAGITGDSLGAANQFVELATYLLLAAIVSS